MSVFHNAPGPRGSGRALFRWCRYILPLPQTLVATRCAELQHVVRQTALEKQYHLPPQTIADEHCVGKNTGKPACKPTHKLLTRRHAQKYTE
jgi:hypothetical protein